MNTKLEMEEMEVHETALALTPEDIAGILETLRTQTMYFPSFGEYPIYDQLFYEAMLQDKVALDAYTQAIAQIASGKTVVEIGTGATAPLAVLCAQAGATKVYAIEADANAAAAAWKHVEKLGLSSIITIINACSTEVQLPQQVDLCVSEIIGGIGSSEGAVFFLKDARRFLKPQGRMLPSLCMTSIAPARLPDELYQGPDFDALVGYYQEKTYQAVGRRFNFTRYSIFNFPGSHLLSHPAVFERIDFNEPLDTHSYQRVSFPFSQSGTCDGFLLWVELHLDDQNIINTFRGTRWAPVFLHTMPFDFQAGDTLILGCEVSPSQDHIHPDYRIQGQLMRQDCIVHQFDIHSPYTE